MRAARSKKKRRWFRLGENRTHRTSEESGHSERRKVLVLSVAMFGSVAADVAASIAPAIGGIILILRET